MTSTIAPKQNVQHDGRPAVVITVPSEGATGHLMVGIRYLDVERWADVPGFPGMQMPAPGSCTIARVEDLTVEA